jgi:glucosylceramidase
MAGFGAAMTDSAAWLITNRLGSSARDALMTRLFHPQRGIGLSYVRVPMGASDFALANYTYDDMPVGQTDPTLAHFSIEHDRAYILPLLRRARALNPQVGVMASPWSAPAWMKTSGSLFGGGLRPEFSSAYATYFAKFVQAYAQEGVRVDAVTLQNEPHHESTTYPSMRLDAGIAVAFARDYLVPALRGTGLSTKVLVWDHNWDEPEYPLAVLGDPATRAALAGTAFHCYAGDVAAQSRVHDAFPDKDIYFTECSGGGWATNFGANLRWNVSNLIIGATRNWAKTVLLWNLALDAGSGPQNGGCTNCRGVVTIKSASSVAYNVEYYALGHASKAVLPGARRIASPSYGGAIEDVAFRNPDGSKALVALNASSTTQSIRVRWNGQAFTYSLPAGAVATFLWS